MDNMELTDRLNIRNIHKYCACFDGHGDGFLDNRNALLRRYDEFIKYEKQFDPPSPPAGLPPNVKQLDSLACKPITTKLSVAVALWHSYAKNSSLSIDGDNTKAVVIGSVVKNAFKEMLPLKDLRFHAERTKVVKQLIEAWDRFDLFVANNKIGFLIPLDAKQQKQQREDMRRAASQAALHRKHILAIDDDLFEINQGDLQARSNRLKPFHESTEPPKEHSLSFNSLNEQIEYVRKAKEEDKKKLRMVLENVGGDPFVLHSEFLLQENVLECVEFLKADQISLATSMEESRVRFLREIADVGQKIIAEMELKISKDIAPLSVSMAGLYGGISEETADVGADFNKLMEDPATRAVLGEELSAEIAALRASMAQSDQEFEARMAELRQQVEANRAEFKTGAHKQSAERAALRASIAESRQKFEADIAELQTVADHQSADIAPLSVSMAGLYGGISEETADVEADFNNLMEGPATRAMLGEELSAERAAVSASIAESRQKFEADIAELQAVADQQSAEIAALSVSMAESRQQLEANRAAVSASIAESRQQLEANRAAVSASIAESRQQLEANRAAVSASIAESRQQLEADRAELQKVADQESAERAALRENIAESGQKFRADIAALRENIAESGQKFRAEIAELQTVADKQKADGERLKVQCEKLFQDIARLEKAFNMGTQVDSGRSFLPSETGQERSSQEPREMHKGLVTTFIMRISVVRDYCLSNSWVQNEARWTVGLGNKKVKILSELFSSTAYKVVKYVFDMFSTIYSFCAVAGAGVKSKITHVTQGIESTLGNAGVLMGRQRTENSPSGFPIEHLSVKARGKVIIEEGVSPALRDVSRISATSVERVETRGEGEEPPNKLIIAERSKRLSPIAIITHRVNRLLPTYRD